MSRAVDQVSPDAIIAVMGATGAGKSSFIRLLTGDENIQIGHKPESKTSHVQTSLYVDQMTGLRVMLVDTPGFDDSREEVTDTHTLEKIVQFLQPGRSQARMLNGIIYMHRISDPRVGGVARKNLKMLRSLCGDANLGHVRIVTTNWDSVNEQTGSDRESDLKVNAFKALVDGGAGLRRHADTAKSAQQTVSELIRLTPVRMLIQDELRTGMALGDTSAGSILVADMREMQKKHERELASLKRELEAAAKAKDLALRAELAEERRLLELKITRTDGDRNRLKRAVVEMPIIRADERKESCAHNTARVTETAKVGEGQTQGNLKPLGGTSPQPVPMSRPSHDNILRNTAETRRLDEATMDACRTCPRCEERVTCRGPVGRFVGEMGDVISGSMKAGNSLLGTAGELAGFAISVPTAPLVVLGKRLLSDEPTRMMFI